MNYVGFYGETTEAVQLYGDYPGAMEFAEVLKHLLGMTWWFMMIHSAGLKKQEATIERYNGWGKEHFCFFQSKRKPYGKNMKTATY